MRECGEHKPVAFISFAIFFIVIHHGHALLGGRCVDGKMEKRAAEKHGGSRSPKYWALQTA